MLNPRPPQTNIRSEIVRRRISEVTARTGMTATEFLEAAVLSYDPPTEVLSPRLQRRGWLLVASPPAGVEITLELINAEIEAVRNGERD